MARDAAYEDRGVVYGAADHLRESAAIARRGAQNLTQAWERATSAIGDAEHDGFRVSNNLAVTDTFRYSAADSRLYAERQAAGQVHHGYIAMRAAALASVDAEVGARLDAIASEIRQMIPLDWTTPQHDSQSSAQAVDYTTRPERPQSEDPLSVKDAKDVHRIVDPLPPGRHPGVKTLPTPAAINALYGQLTENSVPGPPSTYPGQWRVLEDGTKVGLRATSKFGGPTVEIWYPDGTKTDVHLAEPPKPPSPNPAPAPAPAPEPTAPPVPIALPAPDLGTQPALTPEDGGILGILGAFGVGVVVGIGELGKLIFSP